MPLLEDDLKDEKLGALADDYKAENNEMDHEEKIRKYGHKIHSIMYPLDL